MVSGPEHYQQAERLLDAATEHPPGSESARNLNAEAQVHATLALAAATALSTSELMRAADGEAWEAACSVALADEEPDAPPVHQCGSPMHDQAQSPVCVLEAGHAEYHADGHGNRWEP